jgi:hypothetical protein
VFAGAAHKGNKETSMSLMDKMKGQAAQALTKAQQGVSQGKAKIEEAQAKHQWDSLLRNLGAAVYAEQRDGGSSDAVTAALAALDAQAEHLRAEGAEGADGPEDAASGPASTSSPGTEPDASATDDIAGEGGTTPEA